MAVISNTTVYIITGLMILSYVTQSSRAAPKGTINCARIFENFFLTKFHIYICIGLFKKQFVRTEKSHEDTDELKLDGKNKPVSHVKPSSVRTSSIFRDIVSLKPVKSVLDIGMDKATTFLIGANNFLNGYSNIDPIDRFTSNFNTLFTSTGSSAVNNYYNIFANFWVNFDAISQFIRGIENRIVVRRVQAVAETDEEESNAIVEETLLSLTAANAQLEDFKNNLNNLLRRQGIAIVRTGKIKRIGVVNDSKDEDDKEDDDEEDEDEDEEDVNTLTHQFNSSADHGKKNSIAEYNDDNNDIDLSDI